MNVQIFFEMKWNEIFNYQPNTLHHPVNIVLLRQRDHWKFCNFSKFPTFPPICWNNKSLHSPLGTQRHCDKWLRETMAAVRSCFTLLYNLHRGKSSTFCHVQRCDLFLWLLFLRPNMYMYICIYTHIYIHTHLRFIIIFNYSTR